jgi:hypothetical protein
VVVIFRGLRGYFSRHFEYDMDWMTEASGLESRHEHIFSVFLLQSSQIGLGSISPAIKLALRDSSLGIKTALT